MSESILPGNLPFTEAIQYLRDKAEVTSETWTDVWSRANAKAFTVAGATTEALVADFRSEVARALENGTTLQEFRKGFDAIVRKHGWEHVGTPGWRARIIYETNLGMAYSAGRYAQQTEPATLRAFPYWQYVHSGAKHPRKQHLAWNGTTLRADDPFWDWAYPPNGWGCGCRVRPVSERGMARMGKSGPDTAPERVRTSTVNKRTGEVLEGSEGVDPGFDYNPGQVWKNSPPGTVGGITPVVPEVTVARPAEIRRFAQDVLDDKITARDETRIAARLPAHLAEVLGGGATAVEVTTFRVLKVAGRAGEMGGKPSTPHPDVTPADWGRIQTMINEGEVHLDVPGKPGPRQLWFHLVLGDGRMLKLIIRRVARPGGGERLIVPNLEQSGRKRKKRDTARLQRVEGG